MASKVLVLNQDYQAISVCSVHRAFVLVLLNKAEMVSDVDELALHSVREAYRYPSIIRLFKYIQIPYKKVSLTRQNVYKRDNNRCAYCGSRDDLTLDHVLPRSRGGADTWNNLVTACQKCNTLKGNRTPEEAEMPLRVVPFRPSFIMFLRDFNGAVHEEWKPYLLMN
jgi:5-methylcytosine-specific restriction endonuclease McrA